MSKARNLARLVVDNNGDVDTSSLDNVVSVGKNRIINGAMMIDQRNAGASYAASAGGTYYVLDRWAVYSSGAGSTCQRVAGPNTSDYAFQVQPASGNTYQIALQRIESKNCIDLAGQTVTVSGQVYIDNASGASCSVSIASATSIDSNYATAQGNFSVALTGGSYVSFSGQIALSTAASNGIELDIAFSGVASKTIKITNVQLEAGSVATPFEHRQYGTELALCQRYYCKSYGIDVVPGTITYLGDKRCVTNAGAVWFDVSFPSEMRASPTVLAYNPVNGASGYYYDSSGNRAPNNYETNTRGGNINGGGVASNWAFCHWTATAEL